MSRTLRQIKGRVRWVLAGINGTLVQERVIIADASGRAAETFEKPDLPIELGGPARSSLPFMKCAG